MRNENTMDQSEMNVIFVHSVIDDADLLPSTFRIYAHLARRAGGGAAWPSVGAMAEHCHMHVETVQKALTTLVDRRMIIREDRPGKTCRYWLTKPSEWLAGEPVQNLKLSGESDPPEKNHPPENYPPHPPENQGVHPPENQGDEGYKRRTSKEGNPIMVGEAPKSGQRRQIRDRTADELALARMVAPDMLASDVFKAAWTAWQGYREERATRPLSGENRAPWTERAASAALKNLMHLAQRYGDDALTKMVARSIDRRWLEVYEPRGSDSIKASTSTMTEDQLKNF